jgi:hypothetical protein
MVQKINSVFGSNLDAIKKEFTNFILFKNKRIYVDDIKILYKNRFFAKIRLEFNFSKSNRLFNEIAVPNYLNRS